MELILRRRIDIASFANPSAVWVKPTLELGNDRLLAWLVGMVNGLSTDISDPLYAKLQRISEDFRNVLLPPPYALIRTHFRMRARDGAP